jgi:aryl-alcohol dehydrogenase-like predicted oxidoreductase
VPGAGGPVSRCVLGASGVRDERGFPLLDAFLRAGGSCIDTARVYGGGSSERAVGAWIRRTRPAGLVILGKGAHPPACRPDAVAGELAETLDRLGVDRIDMYLLHRDDPAVPVGEFVDALEREWRAGRIGGYGGSNWTQDRLVAANRYAAEQGCAGMTVLSNHFSLAEPAEPLYPGCESADPGYRARLAADGVLLMPWSAQARGFFSGVPADRLDPNMTRCWDTGPNRARRARAATLAADLGLDPINVALAYVLSQPRTAPIIGPQTEAELHTALRAADVVLSTDQLRWLETGDVNPAGGTSRAADLDPVSPA